MDLRDQAVGLRGQDGKAAPGTSLPILPHAPDPRKGKRLACFQSDPIRHLALAGALPFVKAIRQDQAALRLEGLPKVGWLLLDSRVVDVPRSSNPIVVPLSSSNPLFFNGLKKAVHFSGNVGA
jgi:hypothetical protein